MPKKPKSANSTYEKRRAAGLRSLTLWIAPDDLDLIDRAAAAKGGYDANRVEYIRDAALATARRELGAD